MTHSYRVHFFHLIWSTKRRHPWIQPEIQSTLYPYIGGIIKNHKGSLLEIGGIADHIHLLVELNTLDQFSYVIRNIKASSSLWIHKKFPSLSDFAWQEGYGSFSVSFSNLEKVKKYIQNQPEHHKTVSFQEEYLEFLKYHGVSYDERFVFG